MKTVFKRTDAILSRLLFKNPVGVEVGVFQGSLSANLLSRPDLILYMVDNWAVTDNQPKDYHDTNDFHANLTEEQQEYCYQKALKVAEGKNATIIKKDSLEAAQEFDDKSLDFVFIDADHSYEGCKADIAAWFPKIKDGGLLCGHDIHNEGFDGVAKAVYEFAEQEQLQVDLDEDYTWFIRVPGEQPERDESLRDAHILNVVCVKWGDKYAAEYVNHLYEMVSRNIDRPFRFHCFTDNSEGLNKYISIHELPDLVGWWNKVYLFKPGLFHGIVLYLDLDICITGDLTKVIQPNHICQDWHVDTYNSSVMCWEADTHSEIWDNFTQEVTERLPGDQDWITELGGWETYQSDFCVSYRKHAQQWIPKDASIVVFHGDPKPHEINDGWVPEVWKTGLAPVQFISKLNTDDSIMLENIKLNLKRETQLLAKLPANNDMALIVGGGASLEKTIHNLRLKIRQGGKIFALNNTYQWLIDHDIQPHYHVLLDAREGNYNFIHPNQGVTYLIASQCHPSVFDKLNGNSVIQWLGWLPGVKKAIDKDMLAISGGGTVGLRTMSIAYVLGYRNIHLYGYDSCHQDSKSHAYQQALNDDLALIEITCMGRKFTCSRAMARQAMDFQPLSQKLIKRGCSIAVHGDGLIPWIVRH